MYYDINTGRVNTLSKYRTKECKNMKHEKKVLPSQFIKDFLDFIQNAKADYDYNFEAMRKEDRITQDYLHMLELEDLSYRERSKIATKLTANRQARRTHKDMVEELEPIIEFLSDPMNKKILDQMSQLLGKVRKIEGYHQNRFYTPKVILDEPIKNYSSEKDLAEVS